MKKILFLRFLYVWKNKYEKLSNILMWVFVTLSPGGLRIENVSFYNTLINLSIKKKNFFLNDDDGLIAREDKFSSLKKIIISIT